MSLAVGDFNGDGKQDLVIGYFQSNIVTVLLGRGDGTFGSRTDFSLGNVTSTYGLAVGDFNGDGKPDIVAANNQENIVTVLLNTTCVPYRATATAMLVNGFVVEATISDSGCGYTNTPLVQFIGGGGIGAEAVAVVSNGVVIAVNVLDAGYGYTNQPLVVIKPPFILSPVLSIAPMSFLTFSDLTLGGVYQLQQFVAWYWSNQPVSFTATNALYTQMVAGVVGSGDYRLALNPVPAQAFATPQVVNGFVVGATVTAGGSGYVTTPAVNIYGDAGSNATAVASISGGVVTNITIADAGIGYTNMVNRRTSSRVGIPASTLKVRMALIGVQVRGLESAPQRAG